MRSVPISEFRANCYASIQCVVKTSAPICVSRYGKPLAEIHPPTKNVAEMKRLRAERNARELEILDKYANELNAEAEDCMFYGLPTGYVLRKVRKKKDRRQRK
jgi:PHD/YefM family antitoxin component YafN of YafNO toxin-antitoxin module